MDYAKSRRWNLKGTSALEFNQVFQILEGSYGSEWLQEKKGHPLQLLWQRNDELASHELFALGNSIKKLSIINSHWTKEQIKISKSLDRKNSQGAIFELYCLASIDSPIHTVLPAAINQAGYDGTLTFQNDKKVRISIKNYGISEAELAFRKEAKAMEEKVKELLKKYNYPPTTIVIDAGDYYAQQEDWDMLNTYLDHIFNVKRHDTDPFFALVVPKNLNEELSPNNSIVKWIVLISPFNDNARYHADYKTYTIIVKSKYHRNEHKNVYDKLSEACFNLTKHSAFESENLINSAFVHLSPTASVDNCFKWIGDYFTEYPDKPISIVILYQPSVSTEISSGQKFIHHHTRIFFRDDRLRQWHPFIPHFNFTFPTAGVVSQVPSINTLIMDYPDGQRETHQLSESYLYQGGNHYVKMQIGKSGELSVNIRQIASGIFEHGIIEIPGQSGSVAFSGKFAPHDELLIL